MLTFYKAVFVSIIRYGITAWFGNLTVQPKSKLDRLIEVALKTIGATGQPVPTRGRASAVLRAGSSHRVHLQSAAKISFTRHGQAEVSLLIIL